MSNRYGVSAETIVANRRARGAAYARRQALLPHGRSKVLVVGAKRRAAKLNIPFSLSTAHVTECLERGRCQATGLPFDLTRDGERSHTCKPRAPSLDRIDPAKGYTDENVRVVCWQYNLARNQWSDDSLLELAKAIVRQHARRMRYH